MSANVPQGVETLEVKFKKVLQKINWKDVRNPHVKKMAKRIIGCLFVVAAAIVIQFIEYPYQRIEGNMCDGPHGWCYEAGWKIGFPFAWWWGSKVSAYVGSAHDGTFLMNVFLLSSLFFGPYFVWRKIKPKKIKLDFQVLKNLLTKK